MLRGVGGWAQPAPLGVWGGEREGRKTGGERRRGGGALPSRREWDVSFPRENSHTGPGEGSRVKGGKRAGLCTWPVARGPWQARRLRAATFQRAFPVHRTTCCPHRESHGVAHGVSGPLGCKRACLGWKDLKQYLVQRLAV